MPRILVLDDEPLISMMLEDWLTELGCQTVGPAHSIREALDLIDQGPPHAAILDISLGGSESYEVAEVLRDRAVPFAFATGHSGESIDARFQNVMILSKPFDFDAVKVAMTKLLEGAPQA